MNPMDITDDQLREYLQLARDRNLDISTSGGQTEPKSFIEKLESLPEDTKNHLRSLDSLRNAGQSYKKQLFDLTCQEILKIPVYFLHFMP